MFLLLGSTRGRSFVANPKDQVTAVITPCPSSSQRTTAATAETHTVVYVPSPRFTVSVLVLIPAFRFTVQARSGSDLDEGQCKFFSRNYQVKLRP